MDKSRAEAIAQALLQPDLARQEQVRRERAVAEGRLRHQKTLGGLALVGGAIGAVVAYLLHEKVIFGILCGSIGGAVCGRALAEWQVRRRAI